jgi:hypothetical protein
MAPDLQSKPLPSACPRLAVLASIFLLPARKHHPLARRKEHPRPSLPANSPNARSAHCVARVRLLPLPPRFPVSHKPAPASAVPQAVVAPPRKLRKPGLTIGTSGAANHQAGARLRFCRGGFTPPSRRAKLSSDSACLAITGLQPRGNGFAIFPGGWYIKSSTPLPPNPDSEFLPLDSYSPLPFYRPGFSRLIQIFVGG